MKRFLAAFALVFTMMTGLSAQEMVYKDATELTLTGKLFNDTPNPYHRVDTVRFKGFTE